MITDARARDLDFYFTFDHRARAKTTTILIVAGTGSAIACHVCGLRDATNLVVSTATIAIGLLIRLATYHSNIGARKLASKEIRPLDLGRRKLLLAEVPALLLALYAFLLFPKDTEADIVDDRLKQLIKAGRERDAQKFARAASASGIPLKPETARLASHVEEINPPLPPVTVGQESNVALIPVTLETGDLIRVWPTVLYLPKGRYLITATLEPGWASCEGEGPLIAGLIFAASAHDSAANVPLLRFEDGMKADMLLYNMFFEGLDRSLSFIDPEHAARKIAVVNVRVINLAQPLDSIIWIGTRFERCTIQCGGRGFRLRNVIFDDCVFLPSPAVPEDLMRQIADSDGRPITLNFRM